MSGHENGTAAGCGTHEYLCDAVTATWKCSTGLPWALSKWLEGRYTFAPSGCRPPASTSESAHGPTKSCILYHYLR